MPDSFFTTALSLTPVITGKGLINDVVVLKIGTQEIQSFENMTISKSLDTLSAGFQISFADKWRQSNKSWPLKPGAGVEVSIGTTKIITGYIDRLDVSVKNDDRSIEVSGRDKTLDMIDSAASVINIGQSGFMNVTFKTIVESYAGKFGISVTDETNDSKKFKKIFPHQDESIFEFLDRLAKERGVILVSNADGDIFITNRAGSNVTLPSTKSLTANFDAVAAVKNLKIASNDLIQGENILFANASYDESERFQTYVVKAQQKGNDQANGLISSATTATAFDTGVERNRAHSFIGETQMDISQAQKRVAWEAINRAAESEQAQVGIQGWLKADGKPWEINQLVTVDAPFIGLNNIQRLITGIEFNKNKSDGTITVLTLTRPDAYIPNPLISQLNDGKQKLGWEEDVLGRTIDAFKEVVR